VTRRISDIGRQFQSRVRRFFDSPLAPGATPLEISHAVLDDVERRLQPLGRGERVFPYTRLVVKVVTPAADRAAVEAAFATLPDRVRERLEELRCAPEKPLEVRTLPLKKAPPTWTPGQLFSVEYSTADGPDASGVPQRAAVRVTILKGAATEPAYTFTDDVIAIGRTAEATDERGRLRRNRVAFLDTVDGVTETVGRAHARLRFHPATREYRLYDEGSSNGTSILRGGATIAVPPRDPRGVRVHSGDEVHVGRAIIRVTLRDR
jgi:FHA domain